MWFGRGVMVLLVCLASFPAAAKDIPAAYKKESKRALSLYAKESYKEAVVAFRKALQALKDAPNRNAELETRKYLVLALYNSGQKEDSVTEYRALKQAAPRFQFDPDEVLPETIAFLTRAVPDEPEPKPEPKPEAKPDAKPQDPTAERPTQKQDTKTEPAIVVSPEAPRNLASPATTEVVVTPPPKRWHWYYLTPLGIGQYLAGSPVRGTIFLLLQLGATALNVAGYMLWSREFIYGDGTARDARAAQLGQTIMNVGFFGIIGSVVAGTIDGAFLEP